MNKIPKGYKQTEIGIIPEDWDTIEASECCIKIQDGTHFSPKLGGNDFLYITSKNIRFGFLDFSSAEMIDSIQHSSIYKRCDVKKGDLLFTKDGANTGNAAINHIDDEFSLLSSVAFLRFEENKYNPEYFLQQILSNIGQRQIQDKMSGNAITRLTLNKIRKLKFPVPSTLAEQTTIATALSDADVLISSLEKLIVKKRNIKQGAMQKLLQSKAGWEVKTLGEVLKVKHGKSHKEVENKNGVYPVLGTGGLMSFTNQYLYNKPSVLIGRKGTIDKPQFLNSPFWTVDTLFYTEIFENYSAKFIFYIFQLIDWYSYNEASGVPSLNAKTIEKIEKWFPPYDEQTRIATILSDMDAEIEALETKLEKYRNIKLGMMQNLLTGKIRLV